MAFINTRKAAGCPLNGKSLFILFCATVLCSGAHLAYAAPPAVTTFTCATSHQGCLVDILALIDGAQRSVYVQAHRLTSQEIATALVNAKARGVTVEVIVDLRQNDRSSLMSFLLSYNIPVFMDGSAHDYVRQGSPKVVIIDDNTVITGSYNFTESPDAHSTEKVVVLQGPEMVEDYREDWLSHKLAAKNAAE